jgi:Transglycosylase-like domain
VARRHVITAFDACVANREKGEPGDLGLNTIHWHAVDDGYYGAYSWMASTWTSEGGGRFAPYANEATPREQSIVFDKWSRLDPGAWPNTIPPCLYLR